MCCRGFKVGAPMAYLKWHDIFCLGMSKAEIMIYFKSQYFFNIVSFLYLNVFGVCQTNVLLGPIDLHSFSSIDSSRIELKPEGGTRLLHGDFSFYWSVPLLSLLLLLEGFKIGVTSKLAFPTYFGINFHLPQADLKIIFCFPILFMFLTHSGDEIVRLLRHPPQLCWSHHERIDLV